MPSPTPGTAARPSTCSRAFASATARGAEHAGRPAGRRPQGDPPAHRAEPRRRPERRVRLRRQRRRLQPTRARSSPLRRAAARRPTGRCRSPRLRHPVARSGRPAARPSTAPAPCTQARATPILPPDSRQPTYDYSDSVVELNPALGLSGHFEPPTWKRRQQCRSRPVLGRRRAAARRAAVPGRQGRHRLPDRRGVAGDRRPRRSATRCVASRTAASAATRTPAA